jgi:hypothetical protein
MACVEWIDLGDEGTVSCRQLRGTYLIYPCPGCLRRAAEVARSSASFLLIRAWVCGW